MYRDLFAANVIWLMEHRSQTLSDIARGAGVSNSYLGLLRTGEFNASFSKAEAIANYFDVHLAIFLLPKPAFRYIVVNSSNPDGSIPLTALATLSLDYLTELNDGAKKSRNRQGASRRKTAS